MAKGKDRNKYTVSKNKELIEQGEKHSVKELVARGNQWIQGKFSEAIRKQDAEKTKNNVAVKSEIDSKKAEQHKGQPSTKIQEKQKQKAHEHDKDQ